MLGLFSKFNKLLAIVALASAVIKFISKFRGKK